MKKIHRKSYEIKEEVLHIIKKFKVLTITLLLKESRLHKYSLDNVLSELQLEKKIIIEVTETINPETNKRNVHAVIIKYSDKKK